MLMQCHVIQAMKQSTLKEKRMIYKKNKITSHIALPCHSQMIALQTVRETYH